MKLAAQLVIIVPSVFVGMVAIVSITLFAIWLRRTNKGAPAPALNLPTNVRASSHPQSNPTPQRGDLETGLELQDQSSQLLRTPALSSDSSNDQGQGNLQHSISMPNLPLLDRISTSPAGAGSSKAPESQSDGPSQEQTQPLGARTNLPQVSRRHREPPRSLTNEEHAQAAAGGRLSVLDAVTVIKESQWSEKQSQDPESHAI